MKYLASAAFMFFVYAIAYGDGSNLSSTVGPLKIDVGSSEQQRFYASEYHKFVNSAEMKILVTRQESRDKEDVNNSAFYMAGFVRGILGYSTMTKLREQPGFGKYLG